MSSKSKVFNRLRVLRTEAELSRQQVADAVGVNWQTIGYLEREDYNPSLALALSLAEFFEVPIEILFSLKPLKPLGRALQEQFATPSPVAHNRISGPGEDIE